MITIEAKQLREAAAEAAKVPVGGKDAAPILANVLIETEGSGLRLCATDLELWVYRHVELVQSLIGPAVRTTVQARLLKDIAAKLPQEAQVSIAIEPGKLIVKAGRASFSLSTLPPDDFPELTEPEWDAHFEIEAQAFADLVDSLAFAISTDATRYYLHGIHVHPVDPQEAGGPMLLRAAATDGHRLARFQIPLPDGAASLPALTIPRKTVKLIRELIDHLPKPAEGAASPVIAFSVAATRMRIEAGSTVIHSKLVEGTFPDYARVIPSGNTSVLKMDREGLTDALERVATIASEKVRAVKFDLVDDLARLSVQSPQYGSANEEVSAEFADAALTLGFNSQYLLDVLGRLKGSTVRIELGAPADPTIIRDPDCDRQLFVIMPLRV